jgi:DNA-binding CsgD family transcriptional regulator
VTVGASLILVPFLRSLTKHDTLDGYSFTEIVVVANPRTPMSQSSQLSRAHVREVSQLVGECRELGDDPTKWRQHLLVEVARLAGAAVTNEYEGAFEPFHVTGIIDWGWEKSGLDRSFFVRQHQEEARRRGNFNPMIRAFLKACKKGRGPCLSRRDVLPDKHWYRSSYYRDYHAPSGADALLYCVAAIPPPMVDELSLLVLTRPLRDRNFIAREQAIVKELHKQVTPLIGGPLAGFHEPSPSALHPKMQLTLQYLLEKGDTDKQLARRLGLSQDTLNRHKKVIFAHFGVSSRTALQARWLKRGWRFSRGSHVESNAGFPPDMTACPPLKEAPAKHNILSPSALFQHSSPIYMLYLIRQIVQQDGDEGAIFSAQYLAEQLSKQFGFEEYSGKTILNKIETVEKLFQQRLSNTKLKLIESIHSRGLSVLPLDCHEQIKTAWDIIEHVGKMMHENTDRTRTG